MIEVTQKSVASLDTIVDTTLQLATEQAHAQAHEPAHMTTASLDIITKTLALLHKAVVITVAR